MSTFTGLGLVSIHLCMASSGQTLVKLGQTQVKAKLLGTLATAAGPIALSAPGSFLVEKAYALAVRAWFHDYGIGCFVCCLLARTSDVLVPKPPSRHAHSLINYAVCKTRGGGGGGHHGFVVISCLCHQSLHGTMPSTNQSINLCSACHMHTHRRVRSKSHWWQVLLGWKKSWHQVSDIDTGMESCSHHIITTNCMPRLHR